MGDWNRLYESCKNATGKEVNDHWDVIEVVDELYNKILKLENELSKLHQPTVSQQCELLIAYEKYQTGKKYITLDALMYDFLKEYNSN